jgi:cysteinyl-tRNA synthetase
MYFCSGHYRQPVEFDDERLTEAAARVKRIREAARRLQPGSSSAWSGPLRDRFFAALAEDFNTPSALAAVFDWVREANREHDAVGDHDLREMLGVLGLENLLDRQTTEVPGKILALRDQREQARAARDFVAADRARDQLAEEGWEVRDGPGGPELIPRS